MFKFFKKIWERVKKMIYKGSNAVEDVYVGNQPIAEVYHGDELVYSASKIKYAGISYVPAHSDGQGGWADGDGGQTPVRCLCLVRKDGAAKAIPFALYNDNVNLAPTDAQVEAAQWVEGNYTAAYNSGYYNTVAAWGQLNTWVPAVAEDYNADYGLTWSIPQYSVARYIRGAALYSWDAVKVDGQYTSNNLPAYRVTVKNGTCYIYYNNNLVKKIRAK